MMILTIVSTRYLIIAIVAMALVTFLIRLLPLILPKNKLDTPILLAINQGLPLAVMTLLILTSLKWYDNTQNFAISATLIAQGLALVMVLISYHLWRQLLISMITGIISLNTFLWLLGKI